MTLNILENAPRLEASPGLMKMQILGDILQILFISVMGVVIKYISELKEYSSSRARLGLKKPKKGWCPVQPGSGVRSRSNWKQRR